MLSGKADKRRKAITDTELEQGFRCTNMTFEWFLCESLKWVFDAFINFKLLKLMQVKSDINTAMGFRSVDNGVCNFMHILNSY